MLVEINLLVQKEKKNATNLIIFSLIGAVIIFGFVFINVFSNKMESDITHLNSQIASVQSDVIRQQQLMNEMSSTEQDELRQVIGQLEGQLLPVSLLLEHLVSLLPVRGYFLNFDYSLPGTVTFDARFDQLEDVAAYNRYLVDSKLVDSVVLSGISTNSVIDDEEGYLPRYIAGFTLEINRQALNEMRQTQ